MAKLLTASLGVVAVTGQVPDLRDGDCVRALADIAYEGEFGTVTAGERGVVTGKGIAWEGRHNKFKESGIGPEKTFQFKERSAVIHRSMVEKMSETEGYGVIQNSDQKCLTVFELDANDDNRPQAPKLQFWDCVPGWTEQAFIYPACGLGPGQLRWAKDPSMCVQRQTGTQNKIVVSECEWRHAFIFDIKVPDATKPTAGELRVGTVRKQHEESESEEAFALHAADAPSECFTIPDGFAASVAGQSCPTLTFPGLWDTATLDV